ncbi:TrmB family transcriptional regulator [archaeon]|nr:TrmB family transcriptional regulator [archaeon]
MIVKEEFLKKIRPIFNLNIYEAKVWVALLSKGVAAAGELAEISGVPRSRSYDILESLEKKGFIVMKLGKPIKYIAIKPEEVIKRIKRKAELEAQEQIKTLEKVKGGSSYSELELLYKQGIEHIDPADMSGILKGRKNINEHIRALISNAEKSVVIVTTAKGFERKAEVLKSALKKARERGISIKIAAPVDSAKELNGIAQVKALDKKASSRFVLIDGKQLVFMLDNDEKVHEAYDLGVWVNTPFFASALENMFELTWKELKEV